MRGYHQAGDRLFWSSSRRSRSSASAANENAPADRLVNEALDAAAT